MLFDLKGELAAGSTATLKLRFESAGEVEVKTRKGGARRSLSLDAAVKLLAAEVTAGRTLA